MGLEKGNLLFELLDEPFERLHAQFANTWLLGEIFASLAVQRLKPQEFRRGYLRVHDHFSD
jgi:hypothetical protein